VKLQQKGVNLNAKLKRWHFAAVFEATADDYFPR